MTSGFFGILHYGRLYWINVQSIHRLSLGGDYLPQTPDVWLVHVTCYGQWDGVRHDNEVILSKTVKTPLASSFPLHSGRQCLWSGSCGSQGPAVRAWGQAGVTHRNMPHEHERGNSIITPCCYKRCGCGVAFHLDLRQPRLADAHVERSVLYLKAPNLVLREYCNF